MALRRLQQYRCDLLYASDALVCVGASVIMVDDSRGVKPAVC